VHKNLEVKQRQGFVPISQNNYQHEVTHVCHTQM